MDLQELALCQTIAFVTPLTTEATVTDTTIITKNKCLLIHTLLAVVYPNFYNGHGSHEYLSLHRIDTTVNARNRHYHDWIKIAGVHMRKRIARICLSITQTPVIIQLTYLYFRGASIYKGILIFTLAAIVNGEHRNRHFAHPYIF